MAKNDNLKDFLTDVADAIREKKGTTDLINPQDFSREIASIKGVDGGRIGYSEENNPIDEFMSYSEKKMNDYTPEKALTVFKGDENLIFAPMVDTSTLTNVDSMFDGCNRVDFVPSLDFSNATSAFGVFRNCSRLIKIPSLDLSKAENIGFFANGSGVYHIGTLNTKSAISMNYIFTSCKNLKRLEGFDLSSVGNGGTDMNGFWGICTNLRYALLLNLGKSVRVSYDLSGATNWGVANDEIPDARQSFIDSLITYSHDRASNGMATATIKLSANTKALLTEDEIAQITNKGFTIS
jgi:hypothetical protein